jgi:hypothetical protein
MDNNLASACSKQKYTLLTRGPKGKLGIVSNFAVERFGDSEDLVSNFKSLDFSKRLSRLY